MCGVIIGTKHPHARSSPGPVLSALPAPQQGVHGEQHTVPDRRPAPGHGTGMQTCLADFRVGVLSRYHFSASLDTFLICYGLSHIWLFPLCILAGPRPVSITQLVRSRDAESPASSVSNRCSARTLLSWSSNLTPYARRTGQHIRTTFREQ